MLVTVLFPFIPLIAAFPLFMMIVELRGHRPQSKLQALLLAFSFLFFAWHGFIARFLSAADFGGPFIRIIDMLLMLLLLTLVITMENSKATLLSQNALQLTCPNLRYFVTRGVIAFLISSLAQIVFFVRQPPLFFAAVLCAVLLALYFERLYVRSSYYPKLRFRLLFIFWIVSMLLFLPVFRLLFLVQVAYIFYKRYMAWVDGKEHKIQTYRQERLVNHQIVSQMSTSLHDFSDLHQALSNYLKNLSEGIEAKSAAIYMWDAKANNFHCMEIWGIFFPLVRGNEMSFTHVDALREIAFSQDIVETTNIVWECGVKRQGFHVPFASQDERILSLGSRAANIQTLILEPLVFDQDLLGVLVVENKLYERYFTESDAYLVRNFSHYATMILKAHDVALEKQAQIMAQMELQLGYQIQSGLLPSTIPTFPGISLAGSMTPAKEIGGDYFDFVNLGNNSLGIVVGDVSGKGVPAGMVMTSLYAFLHAECRHFVNTYRTLVQVNSQLASNITNNMFASLIFFEWNSEKKALHYTSCGHEHILHYRAADKKLDCIRSGGIALAMVEDNSKIIKEKALLVAPNDTVVLYTDGVTEMTNMDHAMFGLERLKTFVEAHQNLSAEAIRKELLETLQNFAHGTPQADDITILVMKF